MDPIFRFQHDEDIASHRPLHLVSTVSYKMVYIGPPYC
jgi:hypothetical protein